jgi:hypothetical protein
MRPPFTGSWSTPETVRRAGEEAEGAPDAGAGTAVAGYPD